MDAAPPDPDRPDPDVEHRMPGWVKIFVVAGIVVALVVVAALVLAGGGHGPSRHVPSGAEVEAPEGHQRPPGMDH